MADIDDRDTKVSRREVFGLSSAAFAAATLAVTGGKDANAQAQRVLSHNAPNETDPGAQNLPLAAENPDSEWSPSTDSGTVKPFKYSFALARKRVESGGWTRQVTSREFAVRQCNSQSWRQALCKIRLQRRRSSACIDPVAAIPPHATRADHPFTNDV